MTVREMAKSMNLQVIAGEEGLDECVKGGYMGDLLSFVIAHAHVKDAWITVQGHINIIAVGVMTGIGAIILAEGVEASQDTIEKANEEKIPLLSAQKSSFALALQLGKLLA